MNLKYLVHIGTVILILILGLLFGCSGRERYGQGISKDAPLVKVKEIYLNPSLQGKVVNLDGEIVSQCFSAGCWFFLKDETGAILINLAPSNLSITTRNKIGRKVKVTGRVKKTGDYEIIAQGVEID